jgi:hypothetical protein
MQNDKENFKDDTLCHCEPERSEGVAISNLSDEIASVAKFTLSEVEGLPRNGLFFSFHFGM